LDYLYSSKSRNFLKTSFSLYIYIEILPFAPHCRMCGVYLRRAGQAYFRAFFHLNIFFEGPAAKRPNLRGVQAEEKMRKKFSVLLLRGLSAGKNINPAWARCGPNFTLWGDEV
jgi:hypothetical protein